MQLHFKMGGGGVATVTCIQETHSPCRGSEKDAKKTLGIDTPVPLSHLSVLQAPAERQAMS